MDNKELLKLAEESLKTDLSVLLTAKEDAKRAVQDKATPPNLAALERATKMLAEHLQEIKDQEETPANTTPLSPYEETKTGAKVLRWLQDNGYQIEKTQFYDDIKDKKLKKNGQGIFTSRLLKKYSTILRRTATGRTDAAEKLDLGQQKQEEEIKRLRLQNKREKIKFEEEQGRTIPKEAFYQELAARLVVLESGFRRLSQSKTLEYIHLVEGKPQHADMLTHAMNENMGDLLNTYATTKKFQVLLMPAPAKDEETAHPPEEAP